MLPFTAEDLEVAPTAYGSRYSFERGIDGSFGGDKKTVDINVQKHNTIVSKSLVPHKKHVTLANYFLKYF